MRTTVDIDTPVLSELRRIGKREGKPLGRLVSELLAEAIARRKAGVPKPAAFSWNTTKGRLLVDLADADAVYGELDAEKVPPARR